MKIKRYVVREMQEAIRLIKQDLGPEAVIVSSYKVPAKGLIGLFLPRLLEVTAALDENPGIKQNMEYSPGRAAAGAGNEAESLGPAGKLAGVLPAAGRQSAFSPVRTLYLAGGGRAEAAAVPEAFPSGQKGEIPDGRQARRPTIDDTRASRQGREEAHLFDMVYNRQVEVELNGDPVLRWRKVLLDLEIQENIVEQLLSALPGGQDLSGGGERHIYKNLLKKVIHLLEPAYRSRERGRVLAFVGPAGVGKTTTLAKLATQFSLYDRKKVALVAVYTYRIGAVEQLQAYGDFLGVPVDVVMTPAELARVLESHSDKDYILIDTAGRSARNAGQVLELKGFLDVLEEPRDVFLVLSSAAKNRDLMKTAQEFHRIGYSRLVFTRLDETETYGSILNLVCTLGTPVAYLAGGQGIPDDISEAGPKEIAKLLLGGVEPDEVVAT